MGGARVRTCDGSRVSSTARYRQLPSRVTRPGAARPLSRPRRPGTRRSIRSPPRSTLFPEPVAFKRSNSTRRIPVSSLPGIATFGQSKFLAGTEVLNSNQFDQGHVVGTRFTLNVRSDACRRWAVSYLAVQNPRQDWNSSDSPASGWRRGPRRAPASAGQGVGRLVTRAFESSRQVRRPGETIVRGNISVALGE